jgi:hypothetical protein
MERSKLNYLVSGIISLVVVCFGFVLISGCATAPEKAEGPVATLKVCPTGEISTLKYFMKEPETGGGPKLHFKIGIKNISDKPKRFNLSIALPEGPSAGGYYPKQKKKGKIPLLKPGEELVRVFRLYFDRVPDALTIKVEEV